MENIFNNVSFDPSGCWNWTGGVWANGRYGYIKVGGKSQSAHRVLFQMFVGLIPPGIEVCHRCDNTKCVNPDHLFLGTHQDNMEDAQNKGRLKNGDQRGGANGNVKYNEAFASAVRQYYAANKPTFSKLASVFGLKSKGHAHAIIRNKIWI